MRNAEQPEGAGHEQDHAAPGAMPGQVSDGNDGDAEDQVDRRLRIPVEVHARNLLWTWRLGLRSPGITDLDGLIGAKVRNLGVGDSVGPDLVELVVHFNHLAVERVERAQAEVAVLLELTEGRVTVVELEQD